MISIHNALPGPAGDLKVSHPVTRVTHDHYRGEDTVWYATLTEEEWLAYKAAYTEGELYQEWGYACENEITAAVTGQDRGEIDNSHLFGISSGGYNAMWYPQEKTVIVRTSNYYD